MQMAENSADYAEYETVLAYNPDKYKQVTRYLLKMDKFVESKNDLAHLDPADVVAKYNECEMRKAPMLEGLIITV